LRYRANYVILKFFFLNTEEVKFTKTTFLPLKLNFKKFTLYRPPMTLRGSRGIALLFHDLGARRGWVVSTTLQPLYPGKTRYPLYRRLGGPQGRPGRVRKISPPPGFDPLTVQPVVSNSTD
jgi:hypothetical protein